MANKEYLDREGLAIYDALLKKYIADGFSSKDAADLTEQKLKDYVDEQINASMSIGELGEGF